MEAIRSCANLRLLGLMTIPPWTEDGEQSRPYFARLRSLAEENHLAHLSMGMSHDFEVAIEEGATIIRVGMALFGPRKRGKSDLKVGFFSPLPPAHTGVADYSAELLGALKGLGQVDVNSSSADVSLYHLGNNPLHREIYRRALEKPGAIRN